MNFSLLFKIQGTRLYLSCARQCHIYKIRYVPSHEIAETLVKNIIYNHKGIVALNKPAGISFAKNPTGDINDKCDVTLPTLLPFLKKLLGYSKLYPVKFPERNVSGVSVFCTDKATESRLEVTLKSMKCHKIPVECYSAVVLGSPIPEQGQFEGGITLRTRPDSKEKKVDFVEDFSHNSLRRGDSKRILISHRTVSSSETREASVVSVTTNTTKWQCHRAYLAGRLLSPILGDQLFSCRVGSLLGRPAAADLFAPRSLQKLPKDVKERLGVGSRSDLEVPLHLHLSSVRLQGFGGRESLLLEAEPPDYFRWTCQELALSLQEQQEDNSPASLAESNS